jgi:hypothetical protein
MQAQITRLAREDLWRLLRRRAGANPNPVSFCVQADGSLRECRAGAASEPVARHGGGPKPRQRGTPTSSER